jgi:hypothetical protein
MTFNLELEVKGQNAINTLACEELHSLIPQLLPYVGKKIQTQSGKSAKFIYSHVVRTDVFKRCWLALSDCSMWLEIDTTVKDKEFASGGHSVEYFKRKIYLGELKDGVLQSVNTNVIEDNKLNKVFDAKELRETIKEVKALEERARELRNNSGLPDHHFKY